MSKVDYIDLCDSENNINQPKSLNQKLNGTHIKTQELSFRPKTVALKCIGLSLIRMQYGDKLSKLTSNPIPNGQSKSNLQKDDIWASIWTDDHFSSKRYPLKHMLEQKYDKSWKCPHNRSLFCQNTNKISRIQWIHHVRRGHLRIHHQWRKLLKRNQQTGMSHIFEVTCVLCSKTRKVTPVTPNEFLQHMKKMHPQFLVYSDYFTYFQRCYICNDETKTFPQNINHRQICITAVNNDPNQAGTANFNDCFTSQPGRSIVSVSMENDAKKSFDQKLKSFNSFRRTALYYWLSRKKIDYRKSVTMASNGTSQLQDKHSLSTVPQSEVNMNPMKHPVGSSVSISERIPPGSMRNLSIPSDRFFMPIPFPLRNELIVKKSYSDWCKLVNPANSKIPKVNPIYCELCNAMLRNAHSLYCHIKMCHTNVLLADNQCKSCDKRFLTSQGYKIHYKTAKRCLVARKCGICGQSISINDIYSHLYDNHKSSFGKVLELGSCLICRNSITDVGKHLFDAHGISNAVITQPETAGLTNYRNGTLFNCTKCSLTFISEIEFRNHAINRDHQFECPKCPRLKFCLHWELISHQKSLHPEEESDLSCEICSEVENHPSALQQMKFENPSDKVSHFLNSHSSHCAVVLSKIDVNLDRDL